mgnify:CR=1 FL=1
MKNFFKKLLVKIVLFFDGVPGATLQTLFNILDVFKRVINNPALDIIVEMSKTEQDDKILAVVRHYIADFASTFDASGQAFVQCRSVIMDDKRVLCYLKAILKLTGKTPGELLKDLFFFIADKKNIDALPSHLELIHETTK